MTNIIGMALIVLSVQTNYPATYSEVITCAEAGCPNATNEACMFWHSRERTASNVVQVVTTIGAGETPLFRIIDQRSDEQWYDMRRWTDGVFIERIDE